ncbi:hypothetical protein ACVOMV_15380 [Mesorhizobium atlanticum]
MAAKFFACSRPVPTIAAVAVLALPDRLVEAFDRAEKRFSLDRLGYALAVDRRVAELTGRAVTTPCVGKERLSVTILPATAATAAAPT